MSGVKFSQFLTGGEFLITDTIAGLRSGNNTDFLFGTGIKDSLGAYLYRYFPPMSGTAVNYVAFNSALTGNTPGLTAMGTDTNINVSLNPQGTGLVILGGNSAMQVPYGTTAQRPSGQEGYARINTSTGLWEWWDNLTDAWINSSSIGVVTSVTGTAPIASSGGTTPVLSLNGTTTANQVLMSATATTTAYSTATYPPTTTANQILYSSSNNTVAGLATANSGVLVTSSGGVPSIGSTLPSGVQGNITATGALASGSLASGFTPVTVPIGGTGLSSATAYMPICGGTSTTGALQSVSTSGATAGYVLTYVSSSALPTWQANAGGGTVNAGLQNELAWYAANGTTLSGLTTADSGTLITSSGGVPSISQTLPSAVQGNITAVGALASGSLASGFTVVTPALGGTGVANSSTITIGGNVTFSGAYTFAGTVTANTAVTFPTSGTLVNTGVTTLSSLVSVGTLTTGALGSGFTAVSVPQGGSGRAVTTAYMPICGGTTTTAAQQSVSTSGATAGYVLTYVSSSALPTWQASGGGGGGSAITNAVTQVAHGFSVQQLVYLSGATTYALAEATSAALAEVVGIVTVVTDSDDFIITTSGYCTGFSGLTAGTVYWVSDVTAGLLTATMPTTVGNIAKPVFVADSSTSGYFINYRGEVIPTALNTPFSLALGGTNADLTAVAGALVYSSSTAMAFTAAGSTGQIILSQGTSEPIWTTSTYPATNAANTILYASSANTMAALATANTAVLSTNASGVPSLTVTPNASNFIYGQTSTVSAGTTTTLSATSKRLQVLTGSSGQTYKLPDATTLAPGWIFEFNNNSSMICTIEDNGSNVLYYMPAGGYTRLLCLTNGSAAGTWDEHSFLPSSCAFGNAGATISGTLYATTSVESMEYIVQGSSSGLITILPQAAAGTYNFNLPTTAGTSGYVLTSAGGGSSPMTWTNLGGTPVITLDADSGSATGATITISGGTTGLTTSASSSTLDLTGTLKLANGGTNASLTASAGGVVWSDSTKLNILAGTATAGQLLLSGNAATPAWSTSTYPATNAINTMLYASSANVMTALATATTAVLTTSSGVPTWASELSLALGGTNAALTASNGGIFYSTASAGAILAGTATAGQLLTSGSSTTPAWTTSTYPATNAINTLLYASSANVMAALATADNGVLITSSGGVPSISSTLPTAVQDNIVATGALATGSLATGFTVVTVPLGGTGRSVTVAYMPVVGGTTTTAAMQSVATTGVGANGGNSLTSQGTGAIPAWATIPGLNRLINGDFQVWQRFGGTVSVAASTTQFTADRWKIITNANQACTVTQEADTVSNAYYARVQRNSGQTGTGIIRFGQTIAIDRCYGAAGFNVTINFRALAGANFSAASSNLRCQVYTGTGATNVSGLNGGFTGTANAISTLNAITTSDAFYTLTSASAIGSSVTQIAVEFSYTPVGTAGANDWFEVSDVMLEVSASNTPFDRKDFGEVLTLCQRYYQKSFPYATARGQNAGTYAGATGYTAQISSTTDGYSVMVPLLTQMIAATAPTFYDPSSADAKWYNVTGSATSGTAASTYYGANNFIANNPQVAGDSAGNLIMVHWDIDADF